MSFKMKSAVLNFFAIFAIVSCLELPPDLQEFVNDLHKTCIEKSHVTEEDYKAYDVKAKPHDPKLMCYMKCLMLEAKWMSPDGAIQYNFIEETAHPQLKDLIVAALNQCRNIEDDADLCQKASNFNLCFYQADPVNWYLI